MPDNLKVLIATAEAQPLVKTGGLADVTASLPAALRKLSIDARILMPAYRGLTDRLQTHPVGPPFEALPGMRKMHLLRGVLPGSDVPVYLLDSPPLYDRPGSPYADQFGNDHPDNAIRFGILCNVAATFGTGPGHDDWRPDIVHGHDWHAGLASAYLNFDARATAASVFTIHNLAFQGNFDRKVRHALGIDSLAFHMDGLEFHGHLSFMKSGLFYADEVTTVSPTYAREIMEPELGCGMDGILRRHENRVSGILNGIDLDHWDPATDPVLAANYSRDDLTGKRACALELCEWFELEGEGPVLGMLGRMTGQKGWDMLLDAAPGLIETGARLALIGEGNARYEAGIAALQRHYPGRVGHLATFREDSAHRLVAGADMLVVPSLFEPCGLVQMYALRYGTLPLVHRTGGLADSVGQITRASLADESGTGFLFEQPHGRALLASGLEALALYRDEPETWRQAQLNGMKQDVGWRQSAERYLAVYQRALDSRRDRSAAS